MLDLGSYVLLAVLAGFEVIRQFHYLVSEHWSAYHLFWTRKVFRRLEQRRGRMDDWTRYRVQRVFRIGFLLVIADLVLAAVFDLPVATALLEAPGAVLGVLPLALRLVFGFFFVIVQFVGLFWFLSRGGVDVYFPDDIKTRFTDVWGQDNVLEKIEENMVFLEDPERIEARGGYVPGGILLWGPPGTGKGEPVSAQIMTPGGPRRMGDLVPGDRVIGSDGRPTVVREVHVLGERDLYRVHFSDGTSVRVTHDHLWLVRSDDGKDRVRSLAELMAEVHDHAGRPRYRIPMVEPGEFDERAAPLHPYLLGVLLGAGSMRDRITLSTNDRRVLRRVEDLLPDGDGLVAGQAGERMIVGGATRTALKELDLLGGPEDRIFLPEDYLWTRVGARLDLLRGLGDGAGRVDARGAVRFHTPSARLAEGLGVLVRSFGGICGVAADASRERVVRITLPAGLVPFGVSGQREQLAPEARDLPERRIVAIMPDGREQARCLRVAAPDHLYVTENFTVTHNTLMAEAVAGETGKPFVFVDPGAFTNMFLGVGILKVKSLFRKARKLALRYGGVILFFDEADSLGSRGALAQPPGGGLRMGELDHWARFGGCNGLSYLEPATAALIWHAGGEAEPRGRTRDGIIMGGMGGGGMGTLNALLTELSGLKKPRGFFNRVVRRAFGLRPKPPPKYRIMVMMATNLPQALDEALLRPGRIDRIYKVGYPSKAGRIRTYQGYFDKVSHELTGADLDKLATITPYATGASMKDLVNESLINAIRAGRERIVWSDVVKAKHLKDLGPPEDVEYIERERHAVAVHEACHAVMAYRVRQHLTIDIATIEKGGTYLGMVASIPPEDQFTRWRSEYESDILVSLASLAGERLFFHGDNSSGVSGDLESATRVATMMEGYWGMGSTVASHGVTRQAGIPGGRGGPGGDDDRERDLLSGDLGGRIENKLTSLLTRAEELLRDNRREVFAVAHALELHKTVTGDDVRAIVDGGPGPLIDGRPYHTDGFLQAADAYHQRIVEAHRAYAKPDVPLPEFPVLAPVGTSGDGDAPQVAEPAESSTNSHPDEEPVS